MPKKRERLPLIPERLLARLWRRGGWRQTRRTLDGRRLRVLYPGRPGAGPGPDFRDAVIQRERQPLLRGDVEVHRQSQGWSQHGHHLDSRYNNVVLHVVLQSREQVLTRREDHQAVPVAELHPEEWHLLEPPEGKIPGATLPRLARWQSLPRERLEKLLVRAGGQRFLAKSAAYRLAMQRLEPEEVLYQGILEALGYSRNRKPFKELALRLPWQRIREMVRALPQAHRGSKVERLLLNAAGLPGKEPANPPENASYPPASGGPSSTPMKPLEWCWAGIRPANHPGRRIAGAATLLARHVDAGLVPGFAALVLEQKVTALRKGITVAQEGITLIGRDRALDIAVNAILPGFHAWGGVLGDRSLTAASLRLYRAAPSLTGNEITREMIALLDLPADYRVAGAVRQQGLIHMYQTLLKSAGQVSSVQEGLKLWGSSEGVL